MIAQSDSRTLSEKHAAYRTIAEYPDMEAPMGNNHEYIKSFHKKLSPKANRDYSHGGA